MKKLVAKLTAAQVRNSVKNVVDACRGDWGGLPYETTEFTADVERAVRKDNAVVSPRTARTLVEGGVEVEVSPGDFDVVVPKDILRKHRALDRFLAQC